MPLFHTTNIMIGSASTKSTARLTRSVHTSIHRKKQLLVLPTMNAILRHPTVVGADTAPRLQRKTLPVITNVQFLVITATMMAILMNLNHPVAACLQKPSYSIPDHNATSWFAPPLQSKTTKVFNLLFWQLAIMMASSPHPASCYSGTNPSYLPTIPALQSTPRACVHPLPVKRKPFNLQPQSYAVGTGLGLSAKGYRLPGYQVTGLPGHQKTVLWAKYFSPLQG